ncbi:hypothetical protein [Rhodothermus marinus]|uniref:hypothetical protein n=1 Tax=Rhodothermus marinus TaxID=29549 RepID=UPI0006D11933|nr:hypothetical protein [Rhodothermus marinus]
MSVTYRTLRVGDWLRLNYRLIGRGWSLPGFWALVASLGIVCWLLGFMLPLFQHLNPRNAGHAATYTFSILLYGFLLLLYPVVRLSRQTDWHPNVLFRSPRMSAHALAFFCPGARLADALRTLSAGAGRRVAGILPADAGTGRGGTDVAGGDRAAGVVFFAAWYRWSPRLQGRRELVALIPVMFWLLVLPNVAANLIPTVRTFVARLFSLSRYVPLLGPYGEAWQPCWATRPH